MLGHREYVADQLWPTYDAGVLERETISLAVQVDGKVRGSIEVSVDLDDNDALVAEALKEANVAKHIDGRTIVRTVVVPGKIVSLITQ